MRNVEQEKIENSADCQRLTCCDWRYLRRPTGRIRCELGDFECRFAEENKKPQEEER